VYGRGREEEPKGHICMYVVGQRSPSCSRVAGLRRASAGSLITMVQLQINKVLIGRCSYTSRALARAAVAPVCCRKLARVRRTWPPCGKRNSNLGTRFCGGESDHGGHSRDEAPSDLLSLLSLSLSLSRSLF
jgi:hypothetical protein